MKVKPTNEAGRVVMELGKQDDRILGASPIRLREILVPIDFSECSEKALQYALPLARQFQAAITLVHVVQLNYLMGTEFATIDYSVMEKDLRQQAEDGLKRLMVHTEGLESRAMVRVGQPVVEITQLARKLETDLIIVATHGRTGLKHVLLGSVAENLVRHAPCPVLVVREHEHEFVEA